MYNFPMLFIFQEPVQEPHIFFAALAPAPVFLFLKQLRLKEAKNMRLLPATAPQPCSSHKAGNKLRMGSDKTVGQPDRGRPSI